VGFLDKAEARIEGAIVSMFSKLSKRQLQPIEISQAVKNAMDVAATSTGKDRTLVPHRYLIKLSAHDKENLSNQLLRAISSEVANYAGEKSYQLTGDLELKISADSGVQKGRIQVGSAAVGSLVSWKPIISYGSERRELSSGTTTFGRDDSADVAIDDRGLSRVHFEIAFNGDIAAIRDLQSTNGTFVDGMRVQEVVLRSGSKISAGRTEFDFELIALTGGSSE
jgi:hypothetical protein